MSLNSFGRVVAATAVAALAGALIAGSAGGHAGTDDSEPPSGHVLLDTVVVPVNTVSAVSSMATLASGVTYRLRATGTAEVGSGLGNPDADAEYAFNPDHSTSFDLVCAGLESTDLGIGVDDTALDAFKSPKWGPLSATHRYETNFVGKGARIRLNFHECPNSYDDNFGALTVHVFAPLPPSNTSRPLISGSATVGSTLTCSPGNWAGSPIFAFQWLRDRAPITGAASSTYAIAAQDAGHSLLCRVSATNAAGARASIDSDSVTANLAPPSLTGSPSSIRVGRNHRFRFTLRAAPGLTGAAVFKSVKKIRISRRRVVRLARKSFTVPATGRVTLRVKLSEKNFRILKLNRKIRTRVTATLTSAGQTTRASKNVTLEAPKRR